MGLSIHYQGGINHLADLPELVDELEDIAVSMGWSSRRINTEESTPEFCGIVLNPTGKCEPLCFIFDRAGRLRGLMDLISNQVEPTKFSYFNSTKTQFVAVESHIWIIGLFRYLKKHYLSDLEVRDEGDYWETENLETLRTKQAFLQQKIDQFAEAFEPADPLPPYITADGLIARIEAIVKKLK